MGNFKCIKPASHRNKSRWPGTNQEKKKIASESIRISAQMRCTFHQAETAPLLGSSLPGDEEMRFLLGASQEGDGAHSLHAAGRVPPWSAVGEMHPGAGLGWVSAAITRAEPISGLSRRRDGALLISCDPQGGAEEGGTCLGSQHSRFPEQMPAGQVLQGWRDGAGGALGAGTALCFVCAGVSEAPRLSFPAAAVPGASPYPFPVCRGFAFKPTDQVTSRNVHGNSEF